MKMNMPLTYKIAVLAGDGIGPEVMAEAISLLHRCAELDRFRVELNESLVGGAAIEATGKALPAGDPVELRGQRRHLVWFCRRSEVGTTATERATGARGSFAPAETL